MGPIKRVGAALYLLACIVVLGGVTAALAGPDPERVRSLLEAPAGRIVFLACVAIMALQALYVLGRVLFARPEPTAVHPAANPGIEVTARALTAVARAAASEDPELMLEDVSAHVWGRAKDSVLIKVDAIDLAGRNLTKLAGALETRVQRACERTLGAPGVAVRVRFFPAKTVTITQEAS